MTAGGLLWAAGILLAAGPGGRLALDSPPGVRLTFGGPIGERLERNIDHWLLVAPSANPGMLDMFRVRDRKPEPRLVPWAGEFAGKFLISAVQALRMTDRQDLRRQVESFVADLIATQAEDGYLGPFPLRDRLRGNWDLWGHYHVMLGLLLWHEHSGDPAAFKAAEKAADLICNIYLGTGRRVLDAGSPEMNMAVIHVLGWLHRLTGNERWIRMMREIEKDWEGAGDYFRQGLAGVEFHRTPRPRWESLHDLQGLVELFRITGDDRYRTAFVNLWRSIARRDRHNTGGFSSGEQAIGHPYSPAPIETCCTIAWMAITIDMLRLTGEPAAADELELSTWNGMLGSQHPSGRWWTYSTPMDGVREASAHAIVFQSRAGTPELNCCSVNGPRGLGMLSEWAVMTAPGVIVLNWNDGLRAEVKLPDGLRVTLETRLERTGLETTVELELEAEFELRIRIPAWSERTEVRLSTGEQLPAPVAGSYFSISRRWRSGDRVTLRLDERLRVVAGDREAAGKVSIYRGPFLLVYDQRLNSFDEDAIPVLDAHALEESAEHLSEEGLLEPLKLVTLKAPDGRTIVLSDFASAGALGTRYRSWLPALNPPPPPVVLERPRDGERIAPGKALFTWGWRRRPPGVESYEIRVLSAPGGLAFKASSSVESPRALLDLPTEPGRDYLWRVTALGPNGSATSETRRFHVDGGLPPSTAAIQIGAESGPDGLVLAAPLRGDPAPSRGALQDSSGVAPAAGPAGEPEGAVAFDGERGRVRYSIAWFPDRDFSVAVRVRVRALPVGRIAQVFSAWAGVSDDPLRITVDGGKIFARMETPGAGFSTAGVPVEPGRWVHIAAVKAGSRLSLHVNGEERAAAGAPSEVNSGAENVALGGNPNFAGNEFLAADLADFSLHARALSPEEIRRLATN